MNRTPCHPAIESLEPRLAPALVTFAYDAATGALSIVGSDDFDNVTVFRVGANHYRLETGFGSFLPGLRTFVDLEKVTSVDILGKGSEDRFNLIDLTELKSLKVNLGDGVSDELRTSNLVVKGTVTIDDTESALLDGFSTRIAKDLMVHNSSVSFSSERITIGGSLVRTADVAGGFIGSFGCEFISIAKGVQIETANGNSGFTLAASSKLAIGKLPSGESIRISGGTGDERLRLEGPSVKLAGGIRFDGGMGNDTLEIVEGSGTVRIGKSLDAGSIQFDAGGDDDVLILAARVVKTASGIHFFGGEGVNRFQVDNPAARLTVGKSASGASLHLTDGTGESEWQLAAAELILKGGVHVAPGDGESTLTLAGDTKTFIGKLTTGQSLFYSGGAGHDILTVGGANTVLSGLIQTPFAAGGAVMDIFGDRLRIGRSSAGVSLLSSGDVGNFTLSSAAGKLAGSVEVGLPGLGGFFHLSGNLIIGKNKSGMSAHVVSGMDGFSFTFGQGNNVLAGDVRFEGNSGRDILSFSNTRLTTQGSLFFDGGGGEDDFIIEALALRVAGSILADGGDEEDIVKVTANGSIGGDVRVDLGASTSILSQFFVIESLDSRLERLSIKGEVNFIGASSVEEIVRVENVRIGRSFSGTFGAGNLNATFENISVRETFDLSTGDGEDSVAFERDALFGNSIVGRLATIQTGGGNDSVLIGAAIPSQDGPFDSTRVRFLGGLTLNGGAGTDSRNDLATQNDFPATPPTGLDTFEQVVAF